MTGRPDLSVIIVSHGHEAMLPACVASLAPALEGLSAEIVVIDNLPDGRAAEALAGRPVRMHRNSRPAGFAANVNRGAQLAAGRHLLILNPDTEHRAGRLADPVALLDRRPDIGILGCVLRDPNGGFQQSFRRFPSLAFLLIRGLGADRWPWRPAFYRERLMERTALADLLTVDWVFGAFMLLRRDDLMRLGGMDEKFRLYYEDVDLCRRFGNAGLATCVMRDLEWAHHHRRASARRPFSRVWRWHVASALRYFSKAALGSRNA